MTGSGPAGELTYVDVKARLARVLGRISEAEAAHTEASEAVAADRALAAGTEPERHEG